jgi:hypothetical protein
MSWRQVMKTLKLIVLIVILGSCNSDNVGSVDKKDCVEPYIRPIYYEKGCNGDKCGYFHTLMLDTYNDDCFNHYDFIYMADKYLDSVTTNLPVEGITFVRPFDFHPTYDSEDAGPIRKNSIVDIYYSDETMNNKVPEITSISIWTNGKRKDLEYTYVSFRQQRMDHYNSKRK